LRRELAHFVGHHREAAAVFASPRGFDGRIECEQIGLGCQRRHFSRHLLQRLGVARHAQHFADHGGAFVQRGAQLLEHGAEFAFAAAEYRHHAFAAIHAGGGVLRRFTALSRRLCRLEKRWLKARMAVSI
jgi:hypothetical protein